METPPNLDQNVKIEVVDLDEFFPVAVNLDNLVKIQRAEEKGIPIRGLKTLMAALQQAVLVVDGRSGEIKEVNAAACEMFGYPTEELVGKSMELLMPDAFRTNHVALRRGFMLSVRKRKMGYHPPIVGLRADGFEVEVAISLTAAPEDDDVMVICTHSSEWSRGRPESLAVVESR